MRKKYKKTLFSGLNYVEYYNDKLGFKIKKTLKRVFKKINKFLDKFADKMTENY